MDWRIWLPAFVAILCFATRALPKAIAEQLPESRSIRLPQVYGLQSKPRLQRFQLRPEDSSVRFHVADRSRQALAECRQLSGELQLGPKPDEGTLTLRIDLASLQNLSEDDQGIRIPDVLGVLGNVELVFHGTMVASTSSDLPGITQTTWLGRIHFGSRVVAQPMQLWRCALPGQALRLQGHGLAATGSLGLPSRAALSFLQEQYSITLGLDLAWRPVRD